MSGANANAGPGDLVDLRELITRAGWPEAHVTALLNTCAAAASKETLPAGEREFARAVADALSGRTPGISRAHAQRLADAELNGIELPPQ